MNPAITSLAILKINWDMGRDHIGNFVPFVAECLRKSRQTAISLSDLQNAIRSSFGLRIPQGALSTILRRAEKEHYVSRSEGVYVINFEEVSKLDFSKISENLQRKHEALIQKLKNYCANEHQIQWTIEEAGNALDSYVQERSAVVLSAVLDGEPIISGEHQVKDATYLVNSFVMDICKRDAEGFEYLESIVKGSMLANVLLFPDLGGVSQRFERVEIYLDTAFLLRVLGLDGPKMQAPCEELLGLLYEQNAELRCFEHTLDEVRMVLDSAARTLLSGNNKVSPGKVLEHFLTQNYNASDIELIISRLEHSLLSFRIKVVPKPPHLEKYTLDEEHFERVLQEVVHYHSRVALLRDIDSLSAIHRLRRGRTSRKFECCDALFVTTNGSLVTASRRFFTAAGKEDEGAIPHCITDNLLTTLVWLKKPLKAPDLPRKKIIADCYAAINPSDALWRKYLDEIYRLELRGDITNQDYHQLRYSTEAKALLMKLTRGDPDAFSQGTVGEVLEKAKQNVRASVEQELAVEKERREAAEQQVATAEAKLQANRLAQIENIRTTANGVGYWIGQVAIGLLVGLLILGSYLSLPSSLPSLPGHLLGLLTPFLLILVAMLSIANLIYGVTLKAAARHIEVIVSQRLEVALQRYFLPGQ